MSKKKRRDLILDTVGDLVINFVAYDRRDDEELERGEIEAAVEASEITVDEIVAKFRQRLEEELGLHSKRGS